MPKAQAPIMQRPMRIVQPVFSPGSDGSISALFFEAVVRLFFQDAQISEASWE